MFHLFYFNLILKYISTQWDFRTCRNYLRSRILIPAHIKVELDSVFGESGCLDTTVKYSAVDFKTTSVTNMDIDHPEIEHRFHRIVSYGCAGNR